jgi:hypothetical protein
MGYAAVGGQPSSKGDTMPVSPAGQDRAERLDQALNQERRRVGADRNRDAAGRLESSHGDPPRSWTTPNTNPGRVRR